MSVDPFESSRLKLARAKEHFDTFYAELRHWQDTEPYAVEKKSNADGSRHSVVVKVTNAPDIQRWSLIAADCAHNLRCALDHAIYAAAVKRIGGTPQKPKRLQYPIFESHDRFSENIEMIDQLSLAAQTFIERTQPYNRGNLNRPSVLSVVKEFDDFDKHRLLNVAFENIGSGQIKFHPPWGGRAFDVQWKLHPIEDGAEVAFFTVDPPDPNVQYDIKLAFHITITHTRIPTGSGVSTLAAVLTALIDEIRSIVEAMVQVV